MTIPHVSTSHLLAQRLDTLLGTKLSQQLAASTRPTTLDFIPQAARLPPLETGPQSPSRPPSPPPDHLQQQARQPLSQQTRQAPHAQNLTRGLGLLQSADLSGTPSAPISLGNTAQLLVQLLRSFPSPLPAVGQSQPLLSSGPGASGINPQPAQLLSSPALSLPGILQFSSPLAATLFRSLEHAVRHSGLFYESHLAQFATGRYARSQLQMEPQARLADNTGAEGRQANAARAHPAAPLADGMPAPSLPIEAALTVRQQLETLAMQTLHWRGEAWPEAEMDWAVSREGAHGGEDAEAQQWSSQLTLRLPKLGNIQARLHLVGQTLSIQLAAPQADAALNAQADTLRQQIHATGLALRHLRITPAFDEAASGTTSHEPGHE